MDDLMDMMFADESPANISDKIKDLLYLKSLDKVNALKPEVAATLFNSEEE